VATIELFFSSLLHVMCGAPYISDIIDCFFIVLVGFENKLCHTKKKPHYLNDSGSSWGNCCFAPNSFQLLERPI